MLSEYLAVAIRNSHLYGEVAEKKQSLEKVIHSAGDAIISVDGEGKIQDWNPAAGRIFGWTRDCVAVQPSDPAVALAMLDAQAEVLGPAGPRTIPMREFHLTQREAADAGQPMRETRLEPGELITGYRLPASADGQAYVKVRERASYEYAIVSAAAAVRLEGDPRRRRQEAARIAAARVALGSVAQRPWRLAAAEAELPGTPLAREALIPVIERAMADATPLPQNGFKVTMARNAAVRALLTAGGAS